MYAIHNYYIVLRDPMSNNVTDSKLKGKRKIWNVNLGGKTHYKQSRVHTQTSGNFTSVQQVESLWDQKKKLNLTFVAEMLLQSKPNDLSHNFVKPFEAETQKKKTNKKQKW